MNPANLPQYPARQRHRNLLIQPKAGPWVQRFRVFRSVSRRRTLILE